MLKRDKCANTSAKKEADKIFKKDLAKEEVRDSLVKMFQAGYDMAVEALKDDNSNPGFTMADYLETLEDNT